METPGTILLIEDNADDAFLFQRALKRSGLLFEVRNVADGHEAISYLKGEAPFADRTKHPFPRFIITDNRTKGMSGFEFLEWLRSQSSCRGIPVIVLGGSNAPPEIRKAYELGVHSYIVKPQGIDELERMIVSFFEYWNQCKLPPVDPTTRVGG